MMTTDGDLKVADKQETTKRYFTSNSGEIHNGFCKSFLIPSHTQQN